jgi:hypothetical protein
VGGKPGGFVIKILQLPSLMEARESGKGSVKVCQKWQGQICQKQQVKKLSKVVRNSRYVLTISDRIFSFCGLNVRPNEK